MWGICLVIPNFEFLQLLMRRFAFDALSSIWVDPSTVIILRKFRGTAGDVYANCMLFMPDLCSFRKVHKIGLFSRIYRGGNSFQFIYQI